MCAHGNIESVKQTVNRWLFALMLQSNLFNCQHPICWHTDWSDKHMRPLYGFFTPQRTVVPIKTKPCSHVWTCLLEWLMSCPTKHLNKHIALCHLKQLNSVHTQLKTGTAVYIWHIEYHVTYITIIGDLNEGTLPPPCKRIGQNVDHLLVALSMLAVLWRLFTAVVSGFGCWGGARL